MGTGLLHIHRNILLFVKTVELLFVKTVEFHYSDLQKYRDTIEFYTGI